MTPGGVLSPERIAYAMIHEKIEHYLTHLALNYTAVERGVWVIHEPDKGLAQVFVTCVSPAVSIRTKLMDVPDEEYAAFCEELLRLNLELLRGAYALEENNAVLVDSFPEDELNLERFQSSLDAIGLTISEHYPRLSRFSRS
ncbi:MAG: hypothetical protein EA428_00070 [Spirochaetaceae bacterium]|nr:MAG: hypothetical protein EA428_00070 [Spirochaetaceae bacterium]